MNPTNSPSHSSLRRQRFNNPSLRRLLISRLCIFLSLLLLAGGAGVFVLVTGKLYNQFDSGMRSKAEALAGLIVQQPDGLVYVENEAELATLFSHKHGEDVYQVWVDGKTLTKSKWLHDHDLTFSPQRGNTPVIERIYLPNGRRARALSMSFQVPPASPIASRREATLVVATRTEEIEEAVGAVAAILAAVAAMSLALAAGVIAYTIRSGLRPLASLADQVTQIDAGSLNARFSVEGASEELQPIVVRLNQLFERLQQAFERERRFSANIAHELRTPLAELLTACEVALKWPGSREELMSALSEAHASGHTMAGAIETLLSLSRCQSGRQKPNLEPVDIDDLCEEEWASVQAELATAKLSAQIKLNAQCGLNADREMLRLVLVNILSNAAAYTEAGGEVVLETVSNSGHCEVRLSNRPHGLGGQDLPLLFEPFWRKGEARSEREHAGLGLALCRALCEVQGLECKAAFTADGFLTISVTGTSTSMEQNSDDNAGELA